MLALALAFVPGILALPNSVFSTPPTTTPEGTISTCAAWVVARPSDNCESLAKRYDLSLDEFILYNPSLKSNCSITSDYSYCVDIKLDELDDGESSRELLVRASTGKPDRMGEVIQYLFLTTATKPLASIIQRWNARVRPRFNSLSYADFSDWLSRSPEGQDFQLRMNAGQLGYYLACHLQAINDNIKKWLGSKSLVCVCYGSSCCSKDEVCPNPGAKRLGRSLRPNGPEGRSVGHGKIDSTIAPRAPYSWQAVRNGVTYSGSYTAIGWPGPTDFASTDWIWQHVFALSLDDDCTQLAIKEFTFSEVQQWVNRNDPGYDEWDYAQVEHWVEKNMIAKFTAAVISQQLPSGRQFQAAANIPPTFFTQFMNTNLAALLNTPTVPGAQNVDIPNIRIMHTLGSNQFKANFLLMQAALNNMKEGILKGDDPVATSAIQSTMTNVPRVFITHLRNVFGVIGYLNDALALEKGEATLKAIRWEWYQYQQLYAPFVGYTPDVVAAWDEWYLDYMQTRILAAKDWLMQWALDGLTHWENRGDALSDTVAAICNLYYERAHELGGYNDLTYPRGTPTQPP